MARGHFFNIANIEGGIKRQLSEGLSTTVFPGEQMMVSLVRAEPNAIGKLHSHPEEQWGMLLEGSGTRIQGGERFTVNKGDFWQTPGNVEHAFEAGPDGALVLDMFAPPREEYRKPGEGFGS